jgi:hypothetical protein
VEFVANPWNDRMPGAQPRKDVAEPTLARSNRSISVVFAGQIGFRLRMEDLSRGAAHHASQVHKRICRGICWNAGRRKPMASNQSAHGLFCVPFELTHPIAHFVGRNSAPWNDERFWRTAADDGEEPMGVRVGVVVSQGGRWKADNSTESLGEAATRALLSARTVSASARQNASATAPITRESRPKWERPIGER